MIFQLRIFQDAFDSCSWRRGIIQVVYSSGGKKDIMPSGKD
jgi:hypothetical protein